MGMLDGIAIFCFNVLLVTFTLPVFLVAKFSVVTAQIKPLHSGSCRRHAVLIGTCLAWRLVFLLSFWIRIRIDGLSDFRAALGKSGRPPVVVANHASFLDTVLLTSLVPVSTIGKSKMFVSSHLLNMPLIGTISRAMGHLVVPFKSNEYGKFEVDKERMAERMREMEMHVAAGGIAGWYPEGAMNRGDARQVQVFRAGGFSLPAHLDVELWCVAFQGNANCWPASDPVGGRPALLGIKISQLCQSSQAYLAAGNVDASDERAASLYLSNGARDRIQRDVSQLAAESYDATPTADGCDGSHLSNGR